MCDIQYAVSAALENAHSNGYCFEGWTVAEVAEVAEDIVAHDSDLEDMPAASLEEYIITWFNSPGVMYSLRKTGME